jgi:ribosome-associated toxin RatA of RatAB toxin-antitoxin module
MVSIKATIEVNASVESVWSIISDIDGESMYWKGLNSAKVTKRDGNEIWREVDVGFMGHKGHQIVRLKPEYWTIDVELTDGPLVGSRVVKVMSLGSKEKTRLEASWNFSFSKVPVFARGFVKSQIENVTKNALAKIGLEAEGKTGPAKRVVVVSK